MRTNKLATRGSGWRWRYPGRGFNPTGRQSTRYESTIQRPPSPPLGPLLQMLSEANFLAADQAQSSRGGPAEITHCAYVASFSWLDRDEPTILIPGITFSRFMNHLSCSNRTERNIRPLTYRTIQARRQLGRRSMSRAGLRRTRVTIFVTRMPRASPATP